MSRAQNLPPSGQMLQGHGRSYSDERLWNKGCLHERESPFIQHPASGGI